MSNPAFVEYYTLIVNNPVCGWSPEFGDYNYEVVEAELEEYKEDYMAQDLKIITTEDSQSSIDSRIAQLNSVWKELPLNERDEAALDLAIVDMNDRQEN